MREVKELGKKIESKKYKEYNYRTIKRPECPYSNSKGIVSTHVYIWWKNNPNIPYDSNHEVIHHINGDSLDNRPENLIKVSRSEHTKIHRPLTKPKVKKTKRKVKTSNFLLAVFNRIKQGKIPSFIKKEMGISKQKLYYYTTLLKKQGIIGKHRNGDWYVKVKSFSLGTRQRTNLHALQIYIPILSGKINDSDWEIKEKLNNWTPKYKKLDILGGLTIKNNNNKSISLFAHTRDIKNLKEIDELTINIRNWAYGLFRESFKVILDIMNAEVKTLHIATEDKESEDMIKKGERFELDLGKKAEKILSKDKIDGKAWIDGSPFNFTAETNDKEWKRAYLNMPFNMQNSVHLLDYIAQNYASHVGIVEKLNKLLDEPKVKRHIKKKAFDSKQTTLKKILEKI